MTTYRLSELQRRLHALERRRPAMISTTVVEPVMGQTCRVWGTVNGVVVLPVQAVSVEEWVRETQKWLALSQEEKQRRRDDWFENTNTRRPPRQPT
jgi:hypothetical protein